MFRIQLKMIREEQGLSQSQLAKKLGVSQGTIGNWESGIREPNFDTISKIADYFDVSIDYLITGTQENSSPDQTEDKELSKIDIMISAEAKGLSDKDKQEILTFIQYKKFQKETEPSSTSSKARVFTTADFEDNTERIAAFGGVEENDDEPLTT